MKLTILGSGTSVPHAQRSSAAHWLETKNGTLLLDISASAAHRMAQEGCAWAELDAIWISHFHLDHLGGLAPFLFGTKYAPQTQNRTKPLKIYGDAGLEKLLRAVDESRAYNLFQQPFPLEIVEVAAEDELEILPQLKATTFSTPHTPESLALRVTETARGGASLVYTSDTGFDEKLGTFARGAEVFLCECSFVREKPVATHLELAEAIELARIAAPQSMLLTHLYPEWDEVDGVAEIERLDPSCKTRLAYDGMRAEI